MKYSVCDRMYYVIKQSGQGVIILPVFVKLRFEYILSFC